MFDGNFAQGCLHIFQCMLERTDAIMNEDLQPIMFRFIILDCTIEHHSEEEMVSCINLYNNLGKGTDR